MKLSTFLIFTLCLSLILAKGTETSQLTKNSNGNSITKPVMNHNESTKTSTSEEKLRSNINQKRRSK